MCAHHEETEGGGYYSHNMKIVAWSILVMGVSLALVIVMWSWFGHIGPKFSDEVMRDHQEALREEYGLPPAPVITEEEAQIPPSLRDK
ncbi:MAG TPA: hypothetical protein VLA68_04610 [Nitrososphaera sp.]|nr:hypothetical protein [Nitrososphaera sp.]